MKKRDEAKIHWLSRLQEIRKDDIVEVFANIPDDIITKTGREFAIQMVLRNMKRLLNDERA